MMDYFLCFIGGIVVGSLIITASNIVFREYMDYKEEQKRRRILYEKFIKSKENDPETNIFYKPTEPQEGLDFLRELLLGKDWCVTNPLSNLQVNTYLIIDIATKYIKNK